MKQNEHEPSAGHRRSDHSAKQLTTKLRALDEGKRPRSIHSTKVEHARTATSCRTAERAAVARQQQRAAARSKAEMVDHASLRGGRDSSLASADVRARYRCSRTRHALLEVARCRRTRPNQRPRTATASGLPSARFSLLVRPPLPITPPTKRPVASRHVASRERAHSAGETEWWSGASSDNGDMQAVET